MLKGLLYDEENLEELYNYVEEIQIQDVNKAKEEMMNSGLKTTLKDKTLLEIGKYLVNLAKRGLPVEEKGYLKPLEEILEKGKSPYEITKEKSKEGKKNSLNWCLLDDLVEVK